ncbi:hypothetical protein C8Q80DRAFT_1106453 [Daedaleopsis nitida]|nr:hypothetical protein C8Q80DRAFT_1106453 [Daedaleopsis nitida]
MPSASGSCWATIASLFLAALLALAAPTPAYGYVPAQGTNQTDVAQAAGQNFSDMSSLSLQWYPMGSYSRTVSYLLVGADSTGVNKGALVHFSEDRLPNGTTTTPWIALVSCDANSTNASEEDDIFTLARDRGAVAALLYSTKSLSCFVNPEYSDPANFDQVMDIFATQSLSVSTLIESEFTQILGNNSKYYWYSPSLLNDSAQEIQTAIVDHTVPGKEQGQGFLFATLTASNATDPATEGDPIPSTNDGGSGGTNNQPSPNTSLAMIILYAITGCVSALFCIVIISGAIRAIRHPERYGPRSADAFGGPPGTFGAQSRARGLTRAILDTFPVVKFGRGDPVLETAPRTKDIESVESDRIPAGNGKSASRDSDISNDMAVELREWQAVAAKLDDAPEKPHIAFAALPTLPHTLEREEDAQDTASHRASSSSSVPQVIPRPPKLAAGAGPGAGVEKEVVPDAIGRETCPICIVDFEEGDDLRVLPCEGHHRFHQECVDQWLLELSSSCPLCRQDFQALQTMMSAGEEGDTLETPVQGPGASRPHSSTAARFSRYLRAARRHRQRRARDREGYDATDPPLPLAVRTTLHM